MDKYPFIIIGIDNCCRCRRLKNKLPDAEYIQIPSSALGFGDSIAFLTWKLNIHECKECKIRRGLLNTWLPYFWRTPKHIRKIRNTILKLGHEYLPVLLSKDYSKVYNIKDYVPGFK